MEQVKTAVSLVTLMEDYANYNLWANKQLVEWLRTKPSALLEQEVPSSFPTIKKTLLHIWAVEIFWLAIVQQKFIIFDIDTFEGTIDDVFEGILEKSEEIAAYVGSLDEDAITEICDLDSPWVKGSRPVFEFIHHLCNHSTYHRGQLITIGRNVGLTDAPMTDFNFYNFFGKL